MKKICLPIILWAVSNVLLAQEVATRNLIIVTLDGLRWQEVFLGADSRILSNSHYVKDIETRTTFRRTNLEESRSVLLPFFWNTIANEGQLYGNRMLGNKVNCANPYWFSYPGYSELLTGIVDSGVKSNKKIENPNANILEYLNQQEEFHDRVAAFGSWDVFPFIMREQKAGIMVNAGREVATGELSDAEIFLNQLQGSIYSSHGTRQDVFTFQYAFEYLKSRRPRVLFIGFDETDHFAHQGRYDLYLKGAHSADQMIASLWEWIQSDPMYKDKTTLLITTDHGRGRGRINWRKHGRLVPGSGETWFAVVGPDTHPFGEMKSNQQCYQYQLASTLVAFTGYYFHHDDLVQTTIDSEVDSRELAENSDRSLDEENAK